MKKNKMKTRILNNLVNGLEFAAVMGSGVILSFAAELVADKVITLMIKR